MEMESMEETESKVTIKDLKMEMESTEETESKVTIKVEDDLEIEEYDRKAEVILKGAYFDCVGKYIFAVKWKDTDEWDAFDYDEVKENWPVLLCEFYERHIEWINNDEVVEVKEEVEVKIENDDGDN